MKSLHRGILPIFLMLALAVFGCATAQSPREIRADECRDEVGRKLGYRYDASASVWRSTAGAPPTAPGVRFPDCMTRCRSVSIVLARVTPRRG